jgi:quercetin 2,3-dioxygenase
MTANPNSRLVPDDTQPVKNRLEPFVVEMGEGYKDISLNLLVRHVATAAQTGGQFGIVQFSGVRGTGALAHSHGNEAEAFYITEGSVRVRVDDIDTLVKTGDFVYIPQNAPHKFTIESAYGGLLCLMTPGGFEHFFTEMGTPTSDIYPPNPPFAPWRPSGDVAEIAQRYNWHKLPEDW